MKINKNNILVANFIELFIYQIIKKPIIKNTMPNNLNFFSGISLINSNMLLILDGKMAKNRPSTKKTNPIAIMSSFTNILMLTFLKQASQTYQKT